MKICKNVQKYVIYSKTSTYGKIYNIRFGFWGPHNLIRKDPEFQVPITFQTEYANMQDSGLKLWCIPLQDTKSKLEIKVWWALALVLSMLIVNLDHFSILGFLLLIFAQSTSPGILFAKINFYKAGKALWNFENKSFRTWILLKLLRIKYLKC